MGEILSHVIFLSFFGKHMADYFASKRIEWNKQ